ncbi:sensor histidine kinase [Kitasatospora sp. NPDC089797]|uniref:sensor histidine kinase n=1 Tax=Kitasatospora sp. NPDC089797 TaxID=3155298 RepID=UPI0034321435
MGESGGWAARAAVGFGRACAVAAVTLAVPLWWAGAAALGWSWGPTDPWSWLLPLVLVVAGTLTLARPVCRAVRALVARWAGTVLPDGYRQAPPVVRMSTGYWWNGFGYERTRRDALLDQRWRVRWRDPANGRDLRFLAVASLTAGPVAALPPVALAAAGWALSRPEAPARLLGALGLAAAVAGSRYAWRVLVPVAVRFLRPSPAMALADRVAELTAQRADATVAQAAEIRRIERDLHDGAQARLVALGLSLATAQLLVERDPERARAMMREAQDGARASLAELRELVHGISPPVLTERGLVDAVRALALDLRLAVAVEAATPVRVEAPIESAVYFGVAELLTNAVGHGGATRAGVTFRQDELGLVVEVEDDGRGGARERPGGGLAGLRRRLDAFDGSLEITSPPGGPTNVRMTVPCESS